MSRWGQAGIASVLMRAQSRSPCWWATRWDTCRSWTPPAAVECLVSMVCPGAQPEFWSLRCLPSWRGAIGAGFSYATFTSAGVVKRGLAEAGFSVRRVAGFAASGICCALAGAASRRPGARWFAWPRYTLAKATRAGAGGGIAGAAVVALEQRLGGDPAGAKPHCRRRFWQRPGCAVHQIAAAPHPAFTCWPYVRLAFTGLRHPPPACCAPARTGDAPRDCSAALDADAQRHAAIWRRWASPGGAAAPGGGARCQHAGRRVALPHGGPWPGPGRRQLAQPSGLRASRRATPGWKCDAGIIVAPERPTA